MLFAVYLLALAWLILFKLQFSITVMDEGRVVNLIPLLGSFDDNGIIRFSEIRVNILAFIPLGIYICMLKAPWSFVKKILIIVGLTFVFEIIQFIFAIGRVDITDVTNKVINVLAAVFTILALLLVALLLISHRWVRIK